MTTREFFCDNNETCCIRLVEMEKLVAVYGNRIQTLESGSHLTSIVGDITEIKELLKGSGASPGMLQKMERMDNIQQKILWSGLGFVFCIPVVVTVFLAIFPRFYDIHFEPRTLNSPQQIDVAPKK